MIDEAEQHLHYDAQADLIHQLEDPSLASQVLYSTHSAGCLPPDLGRGIRAIVPNPDPGQALSTIETGFWDDGPGFSRLVLGLGASVLAFTTPRNLLMMEGPTDAILLPSLFREVAGLENLPFQVAPGIAMTDPSEFTSLGTHAARTLFLVDGDSDGKRYARRLEGSGIDPHRIWDLATVTGLPDANVEELVAPDIYVAAVNGVILRHQPNAAVLDVGELPAAKRGKFVEKWCADKGVSPPSKRIVAQRVVDASRTQDVVSDDHRTSLKALLDGITNQLPSYGESA